MREREMPKNIFLIYHVRVHIIYSMVKNLSYTIILLLMLSNMLSFSPTITFIHVCNFHADSLVWKL